VAEQEVPDFYAPPWTQGEEFGLCDHADGLEGLDEAEAWKNIFSPDYFSEFEHWWGHPGEDNPEGRDARVIAALLIAEMYEKVDLP
jgi:hypothetical protein